MVDLNRVIDDELDGLQRIDAIGVTTKIDHGVAHRCEIHDARHAREILQQYARRHERDFFLDVCLRVPLRERLDVVGLDECVVFAAQQILEKNLHRVGQPRNSAKTAFFERRETIDLDRFSACADLHARIETISYGHTNRNDTSASPLRPAHWRCPSWTRTRTPRVSRTRVSRRARAAMSIGTPSRSRRATRPMLHATSREAIWGVRSAALEARTRRTAVASPIAA